PPAPGTEYAEDAPRPRPGHEPFTVAALWTVGPSGRQAVFQREADGLAFGIGLRRSAELKPPDLALRITLQVVDLHDNTVAVLHTLDLASAPGAGDFSVLLGKARGDGAAEQTTAAWWGLAAGLYLSRVVFEVPSLRTLTGTSEVVFRVDDTPPRES